MSPGVAADTWNSGGMVPLIILLGSHAERAKAALKEPQSKQPDSFLCILFFRGTDKNSIKKLGISMEYYLPMIYNFFSMSKDTKYFSC